MKTLNLQRFADEIVKKRGGIGIRETAKKIGVSPSTLSRIERGYLPDLETFKVVCDWLGVNPGDVLGSTTTNQKEKITAVHFRKDKTTSEETARHLAEMIIYAQRALELQEKGI